MSDFIRPIGECSMHRGRYDPDCAECWKAFREFCASRNALVGTVTSTVDGMKCYKSVDEK